MIVANPVWNLEEARHATLLSKANATARFPIGYVPRNGATHQLRVAPVDDPQRGGIFHTGSSRRSQRNQARATIRDIPSRDGLDGPIATSPTPGSKGRTREPEGQLEPVQRRPWYERGAPIRQSRHRQWRPDRFD